MIPLQHRVVVRMAGSFLSSPHCHSPQENPVLESGIPEWFTSLGPQVNLVLCRNTGLCWRGNSLISSPSSPGNGYGFPSHSSASAAPSLLAGHSPASQTAPGAVHKLPGFRSHAQATLGDEMLWLGLNKLVQLLEALWLLGAKIAQWSCSVGLKDKVNARKNGLERNILNNYPANITFSAFLDSCPPCMETLGMNSLVKHVRESCWTRW